MTVPHLEAPAPLGPPETLDHRQIAWDRVRWTAYLIHQQFRYEYPGQIHDLRQRLVIIPPERHGDQRLITHRLEVSSPTTEVGRELDPFGNLVVSLAVDLVARAIDFTAWIVVERDATAGPITVPPQAAADPALRLPSRLTEPDAALRLAALELGADVLSPLLGRDGHRADGHVLPLRASRHAASLGTPADGHGHGQPSPDGDGLAPPASGDPTALAALAARINAWVFATMTYADGSTGVRTTAAQAFAQRRGVCQDYAHVMLALCRLLGLPARYVSGHLLGEGGSHAWVEVLLPDPAHPGRCLVHPFDPTHGTRPGLNYVTVAVGRDYGDVAPTSGTYRAPFPGRLSARKHAGLTAVEYFPVDP